MLTRDDLIDIVIAGLAKAKPAIAVPARPVAAAPSKPAVPAEPAPAPRSKPAGLPPPGPKGRPFWSEHQIKKALTSAGNRLTLPADAIVSPLASEWLTLRGIEIIRA